MSTLVTMDVYKNQLFGFSKSCFQSWKKLHAVRADILVQKSRTYVAIADLFGDFDYFEVNIEE